MTTLIQMEKVSKRFGNTVAMQEVSVAAGPGTIIGLVGANGCGKSTLLRHIVGLYLPDQGRCQTLGCSAARLGPGELSRIGYVHQEGQLLDWMTVAQHIRYVAAYYDTWSRELEEQYVADFGIDRAARVGTLSPGQRQKLAILLAVGHRPQLLILDEPASALDPIVRGKFLDLMLSLIQDQDRTILISSHILSDIEKVIDHVWIMDAGRIIRDCGLDDLREQYCRVKLTGLGGDLPADLGFSGFIDKQQSGPAAVLTIPTAIKPKIEEIAHARHWTTETTTLSLEELYKIVVK
jgi:ABC-2 type transport system ATP-binding protein